MMSTAAEIYLQSYIEENGPVDIGRFMEIALGHPEHGYYMKKDPLGRAGDFITAPEISQMFGEILGAWAADIWTQMARPAPFILLECGPGRGTLIQDALRATAKVPGFHEACSLHLLETSPVLKALQEEKLGACKPVWHENIEYVPRDNPLIVLANEFFDALPVRQLVRQSGIWMERVVNFSAEQGFYFDMQPAPHDIRPGMAGEIYEFSPARESFVHLMCERFKKQHGAALIIDYGHARHAAGDTLQTVYHHQYAPVLENFGESDLTAHVDFESFVRIAKKVQVRSHGPVDQGPFLKRLGLAERAEYLKNKGNEKQKLDVDAAYQRLTGADQMGSLFKVLALTDGGNIEPAGF